MSYEKINGIPAGTNEQVVILDSGDYVAVSCTLARVPSGVSFHAKARAIDQGGMPILDANGEKVETEFIHSVPASVVDSTGSVEIARDCMMAVLGEPTITKWADVLLSDANIRISIYAAPIDGPIDAGNAL